MKAQLLLAGAISGCKDSYALEELINRAAENGLPTIESILDSKLVDERKFLEALAANLKMPWHTSLKPKEEEAGELRKACSAKLGIRQVVFPLEFSGENGHRKIKLVTYDPFSLLQRQAARHGIGHPIQWGLAPRQVVIEALQKFYGVGADTFEQILEGRDDSGSELDLREEVNKLDVDDEEATVVKFVNQIIREALKQRATDIHMEPLEDTLRIRYRVDGVLGNAPLPENIRALQASLISRIKVMARLDIAEKRLPQDGRISLDLDGKPIDVRVATIPSVKGESISLRLLGLEQFDLNRLEFSASLRPQIESLLRQPNGIVLVTGPTGSGKSTTLYSFLSELNDDSRRIVTIEDPVENKLEGVVQIAIKPEINLTFANGLRSILRGDPNVIMVGEIRDLETAEIAVRSALTGHLVFSTLHTNDAIGGISRLVDMGVEPYLVGSSVRGFMAQRLVRRLCLDCRVPNGANPLLLKSCGLTKTKAKRIFGANPDGCETCRGTGFHGRLSIYELVIIDEEMQALISKAAPVRELRDHARTTGYHSLREYGVEKALEGLTTLEEIVSATEES